MKRLQLVFTFLFLMVGLVAPFVPTGRVAAQASCVDFLGIPDNAQLGYNFFANGYEFRARPAGGANMVPFVNVFPDVAGNIVHGVQFDNDGIGVLLPAAANNVSLELGAFSAPGLIVRAYSAGRVLEDSAGVPNDNLLHNITLSATNNPIVGLIIRGGGNEGVINEICS